jgi:YesN/AraC family two-component response regulator
MMLVFPQVLYGIPIVTEKEKEIVQKKEEEKKSKKSIKLLEKEEKKTFEKLTAMILEYMKTEKPFTDPNYSLDDLAANLNIQKHHLYYCFNTVLNSRFTTIRTQMRVEYAKECLLNGDLDNLSMEGVWTKTGFSSRTNFFVNFKEVTGATPLDFIKNNKLDTLHKLDIEG